MSQGQGTANGAAGAAGQPGDGGQAVGHGRGADDGAVAPVGNGAAGILYYIVRPTLTTGRTAVPQLFRAALPAAAAGAVGLKSFEPDKVRSVTKKWDWAVDDARVCNLHGKPVRHPSSRC